MRFWICHRRPDRTFSIGGRRFPVCSRCTGIYIGAFSYFLIAYLTPIRYTPVLVMIATLITIPMILDGLTQLLGLRESNNLLRLLTGLPAGFGLGILTKALKFYILTWLY
ncbi:MAG: DUF2085 domain-containing protein [Methanobacteriaceae archaeon]|nr:DUF2085 domain-containing protein [Methanobacteriaceae archaeon]